MQSSAASITLGPVNACVMPCLDEPDWLSAAEWLSTDLPSTNADLASEVCLRSAHISTFCRGAVHFDYVSGQGVAKNAAVLNSSELTALLWAKCNLNIDPEAAGRKASLSAEKQMMRLRMLAPLITVNSTQVSLLLTCLWLWTTLHLFHVAWQGKSSEWGCDALHVRLNCTGKETNGQQTIWRYLLQKSSKGEV